MQPWRPFKALCSTAKSDDYALNVSWSLDSSRLIVVNTAVSSILMPLVSKILRAYCFWSVSSSAANFNVFNNFQIKT